MKRKMYTDEQIAYALRQACGLAAWPSVTRYRLTPLDRRRTLVRRERK
ncbi:MAG: hypothetical protein LJE93_03920 [Acidobacteria bacterium]|nr:hypothetical protein [Acidobacteriota bacterium]